MTVAAIACCFAVPGAGLTDCAEPWLRVREEREVLGWTGDHLRLSKIARPSLRRETAGAIGDNNDELFAALEDMHASSLSSPP